ncbi:hypothetical protein PT277_07750 [Acetobacteraceae bacterium ESL0709]|nr:hypothetical protein [Acetobacteraceae bacterium ESL0697]MDF7678572.1 hypothetical protein [Acetobacteraceae bacterium ESL0709]
MAVHAGSTMTCPFSSPFTRLEVLCQIRTKFISCSAKLAELSGADDSSWLFAGFRARYRSPLGKRKRLAGNALYDVFSLFSVRGFSGAATGKTDGKRKERYHPEI